MGANMLDDKTISSSILTIYQYLKFLPESLRLRNVDESELACKNALVDLGIDASQNIDQSTVYLLLINARANLHVCFAVWRYLVKSQNILADLDENLLIP